MKQGTTRMQKKQSTTRQEKKQSTTRLSTARLSTTRQEKKQGTTRKKKQSTTRHDANVGHEVNGEVEMGRLKRKFEMDEAMMNFIKCKETEEAKGSYVCCDDDGSFKVCLVTPSNIEFSSVSEFQKDYIFWPAALPVLISSAQKNEDELEAVVYTFGVDGRAGSRVGFGCYPKL